MEILEKLLQEYPQLVCCENDIRMVTDGMIEAFTQGKKLLLCGNGGSCADSEHIVGELMKGFLKKRPLSDARKQAMRSSSMDEADLHLLQEGLPAISLCQASALQTAFCNDVDASLVFAQQVLVLGQPGDVLLAISTSGNSENVVKAAQVARSNGMKVYGLTGGGGGKLRQVADIAIVVPACETYRIQEFHLPVYHAICAMTEAHFFKE